MLSKTQSVSTADLQRQCQQAQASRARDSSACFELLRRGIEENDTAAWLATEAQFKPMVLNWLRQRGADSSALEDLYADTYERFLRYAKRPLLDHYPHFGAILKYWQQCAYTSAISHARQRETTLRWQDALTQQWLNEQSVRFEDSVGQQAFIDCVRDLIRESITEEELRQVLYLRFELELSPAAIAERHPDKFKTVRVVYNKIDVIKKRLRRAFEAYLSRCM